MKKLQLVSLQTLVILGFPKLEAGVVYEVDDDLFDTLISMGEEEPYFIEVESYEGECTPLVKPVTPEQVEEELAFTESELKLAAAITITHTNSSGSESSQSEGDDSSDDTMEGGNQASGGVVVKQKKVYGGHGKTKPVQV